MEKNLVECCIDDLWANPSEIREKPWKLINTILSNIVANPNEPKYKKISLEKVIPRLHPAKGAVALLENLGFVNEDAHFWWKNSSVEPLQNALDYMLALSLSSLDVSETKAVDAKKEEAPSKCCNQGSNCSGASSKTPAQLELERVQAENARVLAEMKTKKNKEREALRKQIQGSRQNKKDELSSRPAVKSVANQLNFGCKSACLPPSRGGGG